MPIEIVMAIRCLVGKILDEQNFDKIKGHWVLMDLKTIAAGTW